MVRRRRFLVFLVLALLVWQLAPPVRVWVRAGVRAIAAETGLRVSEDDRRVWR